MWNTILESKRDDYARFLADRDKDVGAFLEIGAPSQWAVAPVDVETSESSSAALRLPIAVKDNIAVKHYRLTCASRMLEAVQCPYNARAIERLAAAGAEIVGKTNLDEFGMGSSSDNSALQTTNNPWDIDRVAGGSSGGSAAAVANRQVPVAIGSDTGGSVRQPAAFCGVYGLKPTYGTISRYGLVAYASSLETVGILADSVDNLAATYRTMRGVDNRDHSSVEIPEWAMQAVDGDTVGTETRPATAPAAGMAPDGSAKGTIGVLTGDLGLDPAVERNFRATVSALEELGYRTKPVTLSTLEYVVPAYYTIAAAEASANLARYNGVRYGYRPVFSENPEELMRKARSESLGDEVQLRIILGTYVLRSGFQDQFYTRAQKIRTLIRRELDQLFGSVDMIVLPTFPTQAFAHGDDGMDPFQQKVADRFTSTANLAAVPALTVPTGTEEGLPVGMQLMGPVFSEERLFAVARRMSTVMPIQFPERTVPFSDWETTHNG